MTKHRFTRPGKGEAYETALEIAEQLADDELLEWGRRVYNVIKYKTMNAHPELPRRDAEGVAAKALRIERGRRRKK